MRLRSLISPSMADSSKSMDADVIDCHRIFTATAALELDSVSIPPSRAKLGKGGPNDDHSKGESLWPDPTIEEIQRNVATNQTTPQFQK